MSGEVELRADLDYLLIVLVACEQIGLQFIHINCLMGALIGELQFLVLAVDGAQMQAELDGRCIGILQQ